MSKINHKAALFTRWQKLLKDDSNCLSVSGDSHFDTSCARADILRAHMAQTEFGHATNMYEHFYLQCIFI